MQRGQRKFFKIVDILISPLNSHEKRQNVGKTQPTKNPCENKVKFEADNVTELVFCNKINKQSLKYSGSNISIFFGLFLFFQNKISVSSTG